MLSAYGAGAPPPELRTAWQCKRWECLPEAGGYYDQDYRLMHRMTVLSNIYDAVIRWQTLDGKKIHQLTDSERRIIRWLWDMGLMNNG